MDESKFRPDTPPAVLKLLELPGLVDLNDLVEIARAYFRRFGYGLEASLKGLDARDRFLIKQIRRSTVVRCQPGERAISTIEVEQFSADLVRYEATTGVIVTSGSFSEPAIMAARSKQITPISRQNILKSFAVGRDLQVHRVSACENRETGIQAPPDTLQQPPQRETGGQRYPHQLEGGQKLIQPNQGYKRIVPRGEIPTTCKEAVWFIFSKNPGILDVDEVINRIRARFPEGKWKSNTISHHLLGLSVNSESARKHHSSLNKYAFLWKLDGNRYRLHLEG